MKKTSMFTLVFLIAFVFVAAGAGFALADDKKQTECPVLGNPISKKVYTDYKGKRIYFCCPPCIKKFKTDPEKYMKKLRDEGAVLEDAPASQ